MKYQSIPYNLSRCAAFIAFLAVATNLKFILRRNVAVQNFLHNLIVEYDEDRLYAMSLAAQALSSAQTDDIAFGMM